MENLKFEEEKSKALKMFNKHVNVWIGDNFEEADKELMAMGNGEANLHYKNPTSMMKVLIDCGIIKSWSEAKGTIWKNYKIEKGFTDLFLNGASIWKGGGFGRNPHRITIMNNQ